MMLHTKYQGSMPCGLRQEDFFMFSLYKHQVKHMTHEAGHFCAQGHNLNYLVEVHILNIKALGLVVSDKIFSYILHTTCGNQDRPIFGPGGII